MVTGIKIGEGSKIGIKDETLVIDTVSSRLILIFDDLETIEAMENNLSLLSIAKRTEQTMKEGVKNGKE